MHGNTIKSIVFGFALGVTLRSFMQIELPIVLFIVIASLAVFLFTIVIKGSRSNIFLISLFIFSFALGILRFNIADKPIQNTLLNQYVGSPLILEGIINDDPDKRESNTKLHVKIKKVNDVDLLKQETILATVDRSNDFKYGDELELRGVLIRPANFTSDLGKDFDYISYLRKDGIYFEIKNPEVAVISKNNGSFIKRELLSFKNFIEGKFNHYISNPEQGLMSGILLGSKQALGGEWRDRFIQTGTIHIIALSGYNVTIVAEWLMKFFGLVMATTASVYTGIIGIIFFAIMTGGGSTIVRASIMAILVLLSRVLGRNYDIGRALLLAGFAMILINPWILAFDVSFELSFLATIGLIYLSPKIKGWFKFVTEKFGLRDLISATVATNIFVLPFIIYKMGIFSLVALPANILILPLIPMTMLLGILLIVLSFIPILGTVFGFISYILLHAELSIIKFFANTPFAYVSVLSIPLIIIIISYAALLYWMFYPQKGGVDTLN